MRKPRNPHSEETKTRALAVYAETGSTQTAAEASGVPRRTIDSWIERDPEIDQKLETIKRAIRERTAHHLADVATLAVREIQDRLENGDWVSQGGKMVRRPVPARELAFITSISIDKHAALTGAMQKQPGSENQRLEAQAKKMLENLERKRAAARSPITLEPEED